MSVVPRLGGCCAIDIMSTNLLCEYCDLPLGLFKRKRMCPGCSRWFCTACLPRDYQFQASNIRLGRNPLGPTPICQRCSILAIDNVTKEHLMELRIKDLRQYLESKRIPTAGCREKSELVDLVLEHCCTDAFLRQQAENQRRLRELTRRKEAEEEWEQRRGRSHNDSSPESIDDSPHRTSNARAVSSSPETSSGPDDPDDISLGDEIQVDPPPHPDDVNGDDVLGAAAGASTADNWRTPVYEIVGDFRHRVDNQDVIDDADDATNLEVGVDAVVGNHEADALGGTLPVNTAPPTAPVAPPSYDEVMASSSNDVPDVVIDLTQTENLEELPPQTSLISETSTPSASATASTSSTADGLDIGTAAAAAAAAAAAPHLSTTSANGGGGSDSQLSSPSRFAGRRRIRLEELEKIEDIKEMTPRQLKEILTANFVAYKGCCERWELEDRVKRLWNEHRVNQEMLRQTHERDESSTDAPDQSATAATTTETGDGASATPATTQQQQQQQSDVDAQLCKICWDAVIDCVLLECGHMVTCTDCGRRMAECPICRQYVVRAVHVFRA